eukprot:CAMPEP_0195110818 /NCGR_PEP_ID=MMETSP0448-20130528/94048_1 /TAXON_ID=66468 /ORGANISM="Heterocapsa triquestra, Strain CCMP 448" /LENGTH=194 /DNA_ID=CAMNT_0040147551 /DNA_START=66 /DNA_END=647 /DNA_ORIENTATION=-
MRAQAINGVSSHAGAPMPCVQLHNVLHLGHHKLHRIFGLAVRCLSHQPAHLQREEVRHNLLHPVVLAIDDVELPRTVLVLPMGQLLREIGDVHAEHVQVRLGEALPVHADCRGLDDEPELAITAEVVVDHRTPAIQHLCPNVQVREDSADTYVPSLRRPFLCWRRDADVRDVQVIEPGSPPCRHIHPTFGGHVG